MLGPLSVGGVHELLRRRLGLTVPRPLVLRLHRMAGGNPFFALEVGRVLAARGLTSLREQPLPVPETLRELVRARLSRLPRQTQRTLLAAASLSQPTVPLLTRWADDEERVLADLERAMRAGVVELEGEQIRFSHPMLASVHYEEASPVVRRRIHAELAAVVSDPEERAWHLACKTTAPDAEVAAALEAAALRAGQRGAPEAAADLLEQARRLTPADDDEDARRRLLDASTFHLEAGDTARARTLLESAADVFAHGARRAETLRRLAWIRYYQDDVPAAAELFRSARDEAKDDAHTRAAVELGLAWSIRLENASRAWRHARAAVDCAAGASNPLLAWEAGAVLAYLDCLLGRAISAERIDQISSPPIEDEGLGLLRPPPWIVGIVLKLASRLDEARTWLEAEHERALASGDHSSLPFVLFQLAHLECLAGRWERATEWANEGYESAVQTGQDTGRAAVLTVRALLAALRGAFDAARADAEEGLALAPAPRDLRLLSVLGFIEFSLGNPHEAERYFHETAEREAAAGIREPAIIRYLPDYIEVLTAQGRLAEAGSLLEALGKQARKTDLPWSCATEARCRGVLRAAEGDLVGALAAIEESMQHHARLGEPFELGRTLLIEGVVQRRSKRKGAARASLERALGIFGQLGAAPWAEKAREELRRIGGRVAQPGELTPTERRVAALVAEGRTNKEVAAELFVSVKAVEANLSSIYAKLGIRSRTELARRLAADGGRQSLGIS
jgi:DNA-binding CsgD family transcriptional regulator